MVLRTRVRRNYGGKSPMSIKYQNLHSFKEMVILLCQSILETRRIAHLHGSALFTIPLISTFGGLVFEIVKIVKKVFLRCFYVRDNRVFPISGVLPPD